MDKKFHTTIYLAWDYLSTLGIRLINVGAGKGTLISWYIATPVHKKARFSLYRCEYSIFNKSYQFDEWLEPSIIGSGLLFKVTCWLTHLPLDKMTAISQTIFSDAFLWMKNFVFWLRLHLSLFPMVQLIIIGSDNGLAPNRRQAIIWTNADPIWSACMRHLGGDELIAVF